MYIYFIVQRTILYTGFIHWSIKRILTRRKHIQKNSPNCHKQEKTAQNRFWEILHNSVIICKKKVFSHSCILPDPFKSSLKYVPVINFRCHVSWLLSWVTGWKSWTLNHEIPRFEYTLLIFPLLPLLLLLYTLTPLLYISFPTSSTSFFNTHWKMRRKETTIISWKFTPWKIYGTCTKV